MRHHSGDACLRGSLAGRVPRVGGCHDIMREGESKILAKWAPRALCMNSVRARKAVATKQKFGLEAAERNVETVV